MPTIDETIDQNDKTTARYERRCNERRAKREQRAQEEAAIEQAIDEVHQVPPALSVTKKPKQNTAQYQANRKAMQKATEVVQQAIPMPITQDDEDELNFANMLVGILPKLATTSSPCNISSAAIYHLMGKSLESNTAGVFVPRRFGTMAQFDVPLEGYANAVVHPVT